MFGSDGSPVIQYLVIFAIIFSALAAIVLVVRRLTGGGGALQTRSGRSRQPRLGIVDVYELDRARQLILLRRDNVEHLLLVGGPNDVVIERNIQRGQRPLPEATLRPEPAAEPLPDPLAEAGRLPEPPRPNPEPALAITEAPARRVSEPTFEMPVVVPAPVPGSMAPPPVRLPLDAALIDGDEPGRDIAVPPTAAAPPVREPLVRPRPRTTPPPLDRKPETPKATPSPDFALPPLTPPPGEPRPVDAAILSDMARQLQAAIARPSSAAAPPPVAPPPPPAPELRVDPIAAAMAELAPQVDPVAATMAAPTKEPKVEPAPLPAAAPPPSVVVPPPRPAPPPPPPRVEAPKPEPKSAGNPFSVEEIEAEFARLLGRPLDKRG